MSEIYNGDKPKQKLKQRTNILYWILRCISSQWRFLRTGVIWLYFLVFLNQSFNCIFDFLVISKLMILVNLFEVHFHSLNERKHKFGIHFRFMLVTVNLFQFLRTIWKHIIKKIFYYLKWMKNKKHSENTDTSTSVTFDQQMTYLISR